MSKNPDTPYDLCKVDPKLRSLLEKRDILLTTLPGPLRAGRQALAKFTIAGPLPPAPSTAAQELPALISKFDQRFAVLALQAQQLRQIQESLADPKGLNEVDQLESQYVALVQLHESRLSDDDLKRYAPNEYAELEELNDELSSEERKRNKLERELSHWWTRVVVDDFRNLFNQTTRAEMLEETNGVIDGLTRKLHKMEANVRAMVTAILTSLIRKTAAIMQKKKTALAAHQSELDKQEAKTRLMWEAASNKLRTTVARLKLAMQAHCDSASEQLNANAAEVDAHLASLPPAAILSWDAPFWDTWLTEDGSSEFQPFLSPYLRLGAIDEEIEKRLKKSFDNESFGVLAGKVRGVCIPVVVPFIGEGRTLIVSCDNRTRDDGLDLLQMLIMRATALLGRQVKFTLLDPSGHGQAFPIQRFLPARSTGDDVNSDLKAVQQDIRRINQNVLTGEAGLHKLNSAQLAGEPFEVIVAAGFPEGFDRRSVDTIYNLGKSGLRAGRYTIIHHDRSEPLPKELPIDGVENAFRIDPKEKYSTLSDFAFHFDKPPTIPDQQGLLERIKEAGKVDHSLDWEGVVGLKPSEWWTVSSAAMINTPLGMRGGTDKAEFWLGQNDGRAAAHGVLAGMPGSGKSTLYHGLIMGLATRYSPAELQLYLIDLKQGVEFRVYEKLPHAKVISLNTPAEMTLSILQELEREMERRNEAFKSVGTVDLASYRRKGNAMPRVLLLIDEYHRLFEEQEIAATASAILAVLAKQSRSAGIHMFLGSQQFNAPGMLNRAAIFENFHLKVAMQLQPATIAGLSEFQSIGKRLIRDITVPGKFVMNFSGKDDECITGQAAHLKDEKRNELIQKLCTKAGASAEPPQVFDGEAATAALENFALQEVLKQRAGLTPKSLESLARKDVGKGGGFGLPRWVAGDRPLGLWLGRRFTVYGHAQAMLTRTVQQNLLMVGNSGEARAGILAGMLISVATLYRPGEVAVDIVHAGGDDDDPTLAVCQTVIDHLLRPAGHSVTFTREVNGVESLMAQYDAELATRREKGAKNAPSRLLWIVEPDRVPVLRRSQDVIAKRTPQQERFRRLLEEGSQHGLHVVLLVNSFSLVNTTVDKKGLAVFAHRIGLQMSQDDSYSLFDNSKASSLQSAGSKVPVALYVNKETDEAVRFKPYARPERTELDRLARTLSQAFATPSGG